MMRDEQIALVALLRARPHGLTWRAITDRVLEAASALDVWDELTSREALFQTAAEQDALASAEADLDAWASESLRFLSVLDRQYPSRVRAIHEAPPFLFARGELRPSENAVSVVGSRRASPHGLTLARDIARALAGDGMTVLSGLALGIDGAAHTAALDASGRTVALIGTGIRRAYPREHRALQERIADEGLVLSQFWPDAPPQQHVFPMRNAVMSGYGRATVVVEAGEHSGARIQARVAVEHGRPVILMRAVLSTEWGQRLVDRPRVVVADTVDEVLAALDDVAKPEAAADAMLTQLASA